ncbi:MAG: hypothetical protein Q8K79_09055 [Solirubrobacteraceae bacterium]|nr:hypothetical protein [Solirubrobacteraceae bacterium]
MRPLAATALAACLLLTACGGDDEPPDRGSGTAATTATAPATAPDPAAGTQTGPASPTSPGGGPAQGRSGPVDEVRECLARHGYRATGGVRPPGTPDAPEYEILVAGPRGSAFIAFYGSLAAAKRFETRVRRNAERFDGASVERQGAIATVWVELADPAARERIRDCVRQVS